MPVTTVRGAELPAPARPARSRRKVSATNSS